MGMVTGRLRALAGELKGRTFSLERRTTLGRSPENTIQLEDLQVSRHHAVLEPDPRGMVLRDMDSGNGTYVNDQRIVEHVLAPGECVRIGTQEFRYEQEPDGSGAVIKDRTASGIRFEAAAGRTVQAKDASRVYQTLFQSPEGATAQLQQTQERLRVIYEANQIISSERDLNKLFERVMDQIFSLVPAHNGVILLKDEEDENGPHGLSIKYVKSGRAFGEVSISSSIVNRAFQNGEAVLIYDAADDSRFDAGQSIITQNISSAMCVPLTYQEERLGALYVDTRGTTNAFESNDLELLVALAGPAAIAIRNAQYLRQIKESYQDTLIVLANSIELRDHYTVGHTWRVTNFAMAMARELGWDAKKVEEVRMGGVLHDVGKIAVDNAILGKPTRLTEEEYEKMKVHPERGARLLQDVKFLRPLIPYCLFHHERWDGNGYPRGLAGEDIPIEGRLLSVADTFDAMTSNRPYRKGLDPEIAINEIEKGRGTQFDPGCVDALVQAYRSGRINNVLQDYYKTESRSIACPFCSTYIRLSETLSAGDTLQCHVCHRNIRVLQRNEVYYGELLSQAGTTSVTRQKETSRS